MRKCVTCGKVLPSDYFAKCKNRTDGLSAECRSCLNERQRFYYRNRGADAKRLANKKYRETKKKKAISRTEQERESTRAYYRAWWAKNKDRLNAARKRINNSDTETDLVPMIAGGFARWAVISTERRTALGELAPHGYIDIEERPERFRPEERFQS